MPKIIISLVLGLFVPIAFILGAEPFEVRGGSSIMEIVGGSLGALVYMAVCQGLVSRRSGPDLRSRRSTLIAMAVPVFIWLPLIDRDAILSQGIPMVMAGAIGILAGGLIAARLVRRGKLQSLQT